MRMAGLSFQSMPKVSIPLRFFLTAPWFGLLAALLMMLDGEAILASRWTPESLAFTHLLTLGVMTMVMIGALFQFIPVVTGLSIPNSPKTISIIHIGLIIGCLSLGIGFLFGLSLGFQLALISLITSLGLFVISLTRLLIQPIVGKEAIFVLRLMNIALLITLGLGLYMLLVYAFNELDWGFRQWTNIHLIWGLLGWTVLLIIAVSSQVIPMFHVTPAFPIVYLKGLSILIVVNLLLISVLVGFHIDNLVSLLAQLFMTVQLVIFCLVSLFILTKRKRKIKDVTVNFWRLALVMPLLASGVFWFGEYFMDQLRQELLLAGLIIFGLTISAIMGMLQKIVSFITYIHLQTLTMSHPNGMALLPNMQTLISVKRQQIQFYLHLVALASLFIAVFFPKLAFLAGLFLALDFAFLAFSLSSCSRRYWQLECEIKQA